MARPVAICETRIQTRIPITTLGQWSDQSDDEVIEAWDRLLIGTPEAYPSSMENWTITLIGGRDPLPVQSSWATRERAVEASKYWIERGYTAVIHRVGETPNYQDGAA